MGGLLVALLAGWLVLTWLLGEAEAGGPQAALRIEAIRTGLTVVAGAGGALALLLAARRQWVKERAQRHDEAVAAAEQASRERAQAHQEQVASAHQRYQEKQLRGAEHDATERRVTDLYTKAADLLGSDRPAIRIAGLFALERLAQDHPGHRPMIVEVICAYLRLPAAAAEPGEEPDPPGPGEGQVRISAQRLLARHLRPAAEDTFWPDIRLDLAGARLTDLDLSGCELAAADFSRTEFTGSAILTELVVHGSLRLSGARFETAAFDDLRVFGATTVEQASFAGPASFARAKLTGPASFLGTTFSGGASFWDAVFWEPATFDRVHFGGVRFSGATFHAGLSLEHASFAGRAGFRRTHFANMVLLRWSVFSAEADFEYARFDDAVNLARVEFHQAAQFNGATLRRRPLFDRTRAAPDALHSWPAGCRTEPEPGADWLLVLDGPPA